MVVVMVMVVVVVLVLVVVVVVVTVVVVTVVMVVAAVVTVVLLVVVVVVVVTVVMMVVAVVTVVLLVVVVVVVVVVVLVTMVMVAAVVVTVVLLVVVLVVVVVVMLVMVVMVMVVVVVVVSTHKMQTFFKSDRECLWDMKEKCCSVAVDLNKEKEGADSPSYAQKYQLPDGQEINLRQERFLCPEVFSRQTWFCSRCSHAWGKRGSDSTTHPSQKLTILNRQALFPHLPILTGRTSLGIHMTTFQSISSCNPALWKSLFGHIVLSGGTGFCSSLQFQMQKEIPALTPAAMRLPSWFRIMDMFCYDRKISEHVQMTTDPRKGIYLRASVSHAAHGCGAGPLLTAQRGPDLDKKPALLPVSTSPYATYGAWVGGSVLCSLSTFKDMWVTSKEYKDFGSSIISRRNF
ncbi:hypothetical protein MC885_014090 [Smutsia gigantea]|nr:hypothetical protein MC885_014090 [Smutsia gigantea]